MWRLRRNWTAISLSWASMLDVCWRLLVSSLVSDVGLLPKSIIVDILVFWINYKIITLHVPCIAPPFETRRVKHDAWRLRDATINSCLCRLFVIFSAFDPFSNLLLLSERIDRTRYSSYTVAKIHRLQSDLKQPARELNFLPRQASSWSVVYFSLKSQ